MSSYLEAHLLCCDVAAQFILLIADMALQDLRDKKQKIVSSSVSSYYFRPILLKHCICVLHGMKMCISFRYDGQHRFR